MLRNALIVLSLLLILGPAMSDTIHINNTSPGFSAVPGPYNAVYVTTPMGPYNVSFSIRAENASYDGYYQDSVLNRSAGSGKSYHTCTYDIGTLMVVPGTGGSMHLHIYRYVSPLSDAPVDPDPFGYSEMETAEARDWDISSPSNTVIDGYNATEVVAYPPSEPYAPWKKPRHIYTYSPDLGTFVVVYSDMDYDKDISLVLETLHITS